VEGIRIYADSSNRSRFYYAPGALSVALDDKGIPQVSFLQMRYMGTSVSGDKGEFRTHSVLSFRVKMSAITGSKLASVKAKLRMEGVRAPNLVPLPISRVESTLNYVPLKEEHAVPSPDGTEPTPVTIGEAALQAVDDKKPTGGYWDERVFTISPDDATSQALWTALQSGKVILSLSYAFYSDGIAPDEEKPTVQGNVPVTTPTDKDTPKQKTTDPHVVLADTLTVTVDAKQAQELFKQIDINESVPANYAALSIYCYDFNNSLRPDLFEKVVEIQANSVTGDPITAEVAFSRTSPDVYSATVRFKFAVSLKDPYKYRIREITTDGVEKITPWQIGKPWSQMLDVTTPPEQQPKETENLQEGEAR